MRVKFTFQSSNKITLPVQYNHIVQALIYNNISKELAELIHERGYPYGKRSFKLFTFSRMEGRFHLKEDRRIEFTPPIYLTVASPIERFVRELARGMLRNSQLNLIGQDITLEKVTVYNALDVKDIAEEVTIKMLSPVVAYRTRREGEDYRHKTRYYSPWEEDFSDLINENLKKKYELLHNCPISGDSQVDLVPIGPEDPSLCKVLRYKGTVIKGWLGTYRLSGDPALIETAYSTGLGSKNPQGFGCFELIDF